MVIEWYDPKKAEDKTKKQLAHVFETLETKLQRPLTEIEKAKIRWFELDFHKKGWVPFYLALIKNPTLDPPAKYLKWTKKNCPYTRKLRPVSRGREETNESDKATC